MTVAPPQAAKESLAADWICVVGQAASEFSYDSASDLGTGQSGLYSDKTDVTFDDFTATDGAVRDPLIPRFVGPAATSISGGALRVQSGTRGGEAP